MKTAQILDKDVFRLDVADLVSTYQQLGERLEKGPVNPPETALRSYAGHVVVKSRKNILNPESKAILETLHSLGHQHIVAVNAEKQYELTVTAENWSTAKQQVEHLADAVLSNPVIEDVAVTVTALPGEGQGAG
jgi:phosphoribosylformylglycinamidine synthase PurS subunit